MNAEIEAMPLEQRRPLPGEDGYGCHFISALIGAGASILGGIMGKGAADDAAERQAAASQAAIDEQKRQFNITREDLAPYRAVGAPAITTLGEEVGIEGEAGPLTRTFTLEDYEADPGYQFRLQEGEQAINRAAAARGQWTNPATVRELQRYGQGLASQEFGNAFNRFQIGQGNRFNRLAALAGTGQTAVNTTGQLGAQMAANVGNIGMTGAARENQLRMAGANALIGGLTGGISSGIDMYNVNRMFGGGGGGF